MEDYYERYIDKEHIINQACECILANNSNSLKEEISLIKEKISSLSISDSWQDIVGDKFSEVITKFTESLTNIESSISSDFQGSEKLYLNIKINLKKLKITNEKYHSQMLKEPKIESYEKTEILVIDGITTTKKIVKRDKFNRDHKIWKNEIDRLKNECISLCEKIDTDLASLDNINGINLTEGSLIDLPSLSEAVNNFSNIFNNVGQFIQNGENGILGYIISGADGLKHFVFNQGQLGWSNDCNRAALLSIVSGYTDNPLDAYNYAKASADGLGYNENVTNRFLEKFGLQASVRSMKGGDYDSIKGDLLSSLNDGKQVMFHLSGRNAYGKSGQQWTTSMHWLSVLDKREGANGTEIFISDSGHGGSGWYNIDEFDNLGVDYLTTVSKKGQSNVNPVTSSLGSSSSASDLPVQKTITIPTNLKQAGYTVTCYEADGWHMGASKKATGIGVGSGQKLVHDAWNSQGSNYADGGIAVIDDNGTQRYLVATSSEVGNVGDRLTVHFEDGNSINVLVADQKSASDPNYSIYGHKYGGSTNILEFEVNTQDFIDKKNPKTATWGLSWNSDSPITSIDNHGSAKTDLSQQNGVEV